MIRRPPRSTRTATLFPYTTLFRAPGAIMLTVLGVTIAAVILGLQDFKGVAAAPPSLAPTFLQMDLAGAFQAGFVTIVRSEEHTSELQSLMRSSYAVFCLKKKNISQDTQSRPEIYLSQKRKDT